MHEVEIAIVGAGAAGIAAARSIVAAGRSCIVLEASQRLGGRARTEHVAGVPLDLGCGWLHSAERNSWAGVAAEAGVAIDRAPSAWGRQYRDLGFPQRAADEARAAFAAFTERLERSRPATDRASDALDPGGRWNPFLEALSGYINGAELGCLSVADYLAYDAAASETNWRLPGGYGALIAGALPPVPVRLASPVTAIDDSGQRVRIESPRGTLAAQAVIVTVSTNVLASGAIAFAPALDDHCHAAAQLPLGLADKLFLALDHAAEIDPDAHLLGNPHSAATGSYYLRPFGYPVIECFFGGAGARALEGAGLDGMAAFAIEELSALFGSGFRARLRAIAGSRWGAEDFVRGSYSHALPGCAGARAVLARPAGRVFFAGEACSASDFSTAHGAHDSGVAAAEAALALLAP